MPEQIGGEPNDEGSSHILVVDDDRDALAVIEEAFTGLRIQVHTASTMGDARRLIQDRPFDLAILDVYLPDGDGTELAQAVKAACPDSAIVITSGGTYGEDVKESVNVDADAYLIKPIDMAQLVAQVQGLLPPRV